MVKVSKQQKWWKKSVVSFCAICEEGAKVWEPLKEQLLHKKISEKTATLHLYSYFSIDCITTSVTGWLNVEKTKFIQVWLMRKGRR